MQLFLQQQKQQRRASIVLVNRRPSAVRRYERGHRVNPTMHGRWRLDYFFFSPAIDTSDSIQAASKKTSADDQIDASVVPDVWGNTSSQ